ncbi:MAG: HEAT repeat domain-containing protein [Planctomycetota bacterium]|nr:HEAT repeat domain-containing protein [Planctomycetota bacterium]
MNRQTPVLLLCLTLLAISTSHQIRADEADQLLQQLNSPDPKLRNTAQTALRSVVGPQHVQRILDALETPTHRSKYALVSLLGVTGGTRAQNALRKIFKSGPPHLRGSAFYALRQLKDPWRLEALFDLLNDPELPASEKSQILYCLTSEKDSRIVPTLEKLLASHDEPNLVRSAIEALSRRGSPKAAPLLQKQLDREDLDPKSRRTALIGLAQMGHESITPDQITTLLQDEKLNSGELSRVLSGLDRRDPTPYFDTLLKLLDGPPSDPIASQVIRFLSRHKNRNLLKKLPPFLESDTPHLSLQAFEALVQLGDEETVRLLQSLLQREQIREEIRIRTATALLQREDFSGLPLLLQSLESLKTESRRQATQALAKQPIRASLIPLIERLDDKDLVVRTEALKAIRSILKNLFPYDHFRWNHLGYRPSMDSGPDRRRAVEILKRWVQKRSE